MLTHTSTLRYKFSIYNQKPQCSPIKTEQIKQTSKYLETEATNLEGIEAYTISKPQNKCRLSYLTSPASIGAVHSSMAWLTVATATLALPPQKRSVSLAHLAASCTNIFHFLARNFTVAPTYFSFPVLFFFAVFVNVYQKRSRQMETLHDENDLADQISAKTRISPNWEVLDWPSLIGSPLLCAVCGCEGQTGPCNSRGAYSNYWHQKLKNKSSMTTSRFGLERIGRSGLPKLPDGQSAPGSVAL